MAKGMVVTIKKEWGVYYDLEWGRAGRDLSVCVSDFQRVTGLRLKGRGPWKVRITAKEVKKG